MLDCFDVGDGSQAFLLQKSGQAGLLCCRKRVVLDCFGLGDGSRAFLLWKRGQVGLLLCGKKVM